MCFETSFLRWCERVLPARFGISSALGLGRWGQRREGVHDGRGCASGVGFCKVLGPGEWVEEGRKWERRRRVTLSRGLRGEFGRAHV